MDVRQVLELSSRGWSIMPIGRKKIPLVPWRRLQSRRAGDRRLREWWRRFDSPNAGIVTGSVSGLVVVDCDDDAARARCVELGLPATFTVRTARGWHFYYALPDDEIVRNSSGRFGDGVDVRGEGGYVVAPGSRHASGAVYTVENDAQLAAAPQWLLA
jgi:hypothetical protein